MTIFDKYLTTSYDRPMKRLKPQQHLLELGFTQKESSVYVFLLSRGQSTPSEIARATGVQRASVYNVLKDLVAKGVIAEDLASKTQRYTALPVHSLQRITDAQKRELEEKDQKISAAILSLEKLAPPNTLPIPKIRYVESKDIESFLYSEANKWHSSASTVDGTWWGFQDHTFIERYETWIHWLWKHVHTSGHVRLFSHHSPLVLKLKHYYPRRSIKKLASSDFNATTWVVGDYVVMLVTQQTPEYLIEIHDVTLARNMRAVFRELWERS